LNVGRAFPITLLALALGAGAAAAQDVTPSGDKDGVVHVNAIRNPEMHSYRAIVAGLDVFDAQHDLAPAVPQLLFAARTRSGAVLTGEVPTAKLSADDFALALPLDAAALFTVPRNQQAWDRDAELVLSRKKREVRVWPHVRTPGLPEDRRRLGDMRLECQVMVAVAKKEAPFHIVLLANTALLTSDWCSFFKTPERTWNAKVEAELAGAVLRDGERTLALKVKGKEFEVPIGDTAWSNDALVELTFAAAQGTAP
jgi:hypothetical protein